MRTYVLISINFILQFAESDSTARLIGKWVASTRCIRCGSPTFLTGTGHLIGQLIRVDIRPFDKRRITKLQNCCGPGTTPTVTILEDPHKDGPIVLPLLISFLRDDAPT